MLTVPPSVKLWYCPDAVDMRWASTACSPWSKTA